MSRLEHYLAMGFYPPLCPVIHKAEKKTHDFSEISETILKQTEKLLQGYDHPALFLSGGVDSSVLACACKKLGLNPVAYTIMFSDGSKNEVRQAQEMAKRTGLEHKIVSVTPEAAYANFFSVTAQYDHIIPDTASLASYEASTEAESDGCDVIISGEGGDELFSSYSDYFRLQTIENTFEGYELIGAMGRLASHLVSPLSKKSAFKMGKIGNYFSNEHFWIKRMHGFNRKERFELLGRSNDLTPWLETFYEPEDDMLDKFLKLELSLRIPGHMTRKLEELANTVFPLNTPELQKIALEMPCSDRQNKKPLIDMLPIGTPTKKVGLGLPMHWLFNEPFKTGFKKILEHDGRSPLNNKAVKRHAQGFFKGTTGLQKYMTLVAFKAREKRDAI